MAAEKEWVVRGEDPLGERYCSDLMTLREAEAHAVKMRATGASAVVLAA